MCQLCLFSYETTPFQTPEAAQPVSSGGSTTPLFNVLNALLFTDSWSGGLGEGAYLTYSFTGPWAQVETGDAGGAVSILSDSDQQMAREALQLYANVANVVFAEVSDGTDGIIAIRNEYLEGGLDGYAYIPGTLHDVYGNVTLDAELGAITANSRAYYALVHEIGHALGLAHPFADGNPSGAKVNGIPAEELTADYSVMAYNGDTDVVAGLRLYDIYAIQQNYSPNYSYRAGDDFYSFSTSGAARHYALWDGGGTDTFSAADQTSGVTLDLRDGDNPSFIGVEKIRIAFGAQIENAVGSGYDDVINGNALSNAITAGGSADQVNGWGGNDIIVGGWNPTDALDGNDVIFGGAGSDIIYGNAGDDILVGGQDYTDASDQADTIYGGLGNDQIYGNAGNDLIVAASGDDTIYGGLGDDIFQIHSGNGNDVIYGFDGAGQAGGDVFQISRYINNTGIDSFETLMALSATDGFHSWMPTGNNQSLLVLFTPLNQFSADDFVFV